MPDSSHCSSLHVLMGSSPPPLAWHAGPLALFPSLPPGRRPGPRHGVESVARRGPSSNGTSGVSAVTSLPPSSQISRWTDGGTDGCRGPLSFPGHGRGARWGRGSLSLPLPPSPQTRLQGGLSGVTASSHPSNPALTLSLL